jgi:hypothetical protein
MSRSEEASRSWAIFFEREAEAEVAVVFAINAKKSYGKQLNSLPS